MEDRRVQIGLTAAAIIITFVLIVGLLTDAANRSNPRPTSTPQPTEAPPTAIISTPDVVLTARAITTNVPIQSPTSPPTDAITSTPDVVLTARAITTNVPIQSPTPLPTNTPDVIMTARAITTNVPIQSPTPIPPTSVPQRDSPFNPIEPTSDFQVFVPHLIAEEMMLRYVFAPLAKDYTDEDLEIVVEVLSARLEALEIEGTVTLEDDQIIVEVVGIYDTLAQNLIQQGVLEFVDFSGIEDVDDYVNELLLTNGAKLLMKQENPIQIIIPEDDEKDHNLNPLTEEPFETILIGDILESSEAVYDDVMGQWYIALVFTEEAAEILKKHTGSHIGESLAVVIDGKALIIPRLMAALSSEAIISGNMNEDETKALVAALQSGMLPFPLEFLEISQVNPTEA